MPTITIQTPLDQPRGGIRLLEELKVNLQNPSFTSFKFITAFAKVGPLLRLQPLIETWIQNGKQIHAIFGIDEKGTSKQALEFAIDNFTGSNIASIGKGVYKPTFHPKIYIFNGHDSAIAYIGSNNLTVGGTETNAESFVKIGISLPQENAILDEVIRCWNDTLGVCLPLDQALLEHLIGSRLVIDEKQMRRQKSFTEADGNTEDTPLPPAFPPYQVVPPSPIPQQVMRQHPTRMPQPAVIINTQDEISNGTVALVIQVIPHHNGEILLSKFAIDQNPAFFGWPFTGQTIPKKVDNPSYPQRIPDPRVNITVYDANQNVVATHNYYGLNTVYYETRSEIRITVPRDVVINTPEYSIMVMKKAEAGDLDYDITIYPPNSIDFDHYLAICNQVMPSGGKAISRRFGWL